MRYSYQRNIIHKTICATKCHPTADWIYGEVKKIIPNISLGTVYRNLNQLTENGLINTIKDGTATKYDGNTKPHHHLKCNICFDIIDIDIFDLKLNKIIKSKFDFELSDIDITITGKCNRHKKR